MTYLIWSCRSSRTNLWSAPERCPSNISCVVTALMFTITPDHSFSNGPRVKQSSCGAAPASPEQSRTSIRATSGRIPQLDLSSSEICSNSSDWRSGESEEQPSETAPLCFPQTELSYLKSEPALAVTTARVGNFLPVSLQSSIKSEPGCFIQKFLLGHFTDVKKTPNTESGWLMSPVTGKIPRFCQ